MDQPHPRTHHVRSDGDQRIRVLFLNTRDLLGADVVVHMMLARALDRREVQIWAASNTYETPGPSTLAMMATIPDLRLITLDLGRPLHYFHGWRRGLALLRNVTSIAGLIRLARLCRRERIAVIHVTERPRDALFGLLLARVTGCASVIHAHTAYYRHDASRLGDWVLRHADAVIGVSEFTAATYRRDAHVAARAVFAVHNAADTVAFQPKAPEGERQALRARFGIPADAPLVGCAARLTRWKGQTDLLEAFAAVRQQLPDAHLLLAGTSHDTAPDGVGDYRAYLDRQVSARGLDGAVTFAGWIAHEEMPAFFRSVDVFAHPAIEEPFGLVVVEAMACERAVVAVGAGGIPEIIRDGVDGVLVPRGVPEQLAAEVVRVLSDATLRAELGQRGRQRVVEKFTPAVQARAVTEVYRSLLTRRAVHAAQTSTELETRATATVSMVASRARE